MPPELATEYRIYDVCDHKDKIASTKKRQFGVCYEAMQTAPKWAVTAWLFFSLFERVSNITAFHFFLFYIVIAWYVIRSDEAVEDVTQQSQD